MNIIKILTLYKQHYLQRYNNPVAAEYSCWGYYDCMEVWEIADSTGNRLLPGNGNKNLTDMWYRMADGITAQDGRYGQQMISLLRYEEEGNTGWATDGQFWETKEIFLCVCMLQLNRRNRDYDGIIEDIEKKADITCENGIVLKGIAYRTLDNADLVVFLKGNSYKEISMMIESLGNIPEVQYTHSICGVNQNYLDKLRKNNFDFSHCYGTQHALHNDKIEEIQLDIVANSHLKAKKFIDKMKLTARYSNITGHVDITAIIEGKDIEGAIKLLQDGEEGITHTNPEFGKSIYNINTTLRVGKDENEASLENCEDLENADEDGRKIERDIDWVGNWCEKNIEKLKSMLPEIIDKQNEMLYSYYQAMIQSLNVIAQYEESSFSKDLFYIVYPAMSLFYQQFYKRMELIKNDDMVNWPNQKIQTFDESIRLFIDAVDSIIYRSIHTTQNFLMVPGYCGVLYDIPTKLFLMYAACAKEIMNMLNDSYNKYECCLSPVVNSRPNTRIIDLGIDSQDRLILIKLSQRYLFMPRTLLIILGHEIAHYVGNMTRQRALRTQMMVRMTAYAAAEEIFNFSQHMYQQYGFLIEKMSQVKENVQVYLTKEIQLILKKRLEKYGDDKKYHFSVIKKELIWVCYEIIRDSTGKLNDILCSLEGELSTIDYRDYDSLRILYDDIRQRVIRMKFDDIIKNIIEILLNSLKEGYSDIAAVLLFNLDKDWKYYLENFIVSEGMTVKKESIDTIVINRISMVVNALCQADGTDGVRKRKWDDLVRMEKDKQDDIMAYIVCQVDKHIRIFNGEIIEEEIPCGRYQRTQKEELLIFELDAVWKYEKLYLKACAEQLEKRIHKESRLMDLFTVFKMYNFNEDCSYKEWFRSFDNLISTYDTSVDKQKKEELLGQSNDKK